MVDNQIAKSHTEYEAYGVKFVTTFKDGHPPQTQVKYRDFTRYVTGDFPDEDKEEMAKEIVSGYDAEQNKRSMVLVHKLAQMGNIGIAINTPVEFIDPHSGGTLMGTGVLFASAQIRRSDDPSNSSELDDLPELEPDDDLPELEPIPPEMDITHHHY